jgi:hypothetical protein
MGYQQQTRSRRGSGRGYGRPRREKSKVKAKGQKPRSSGSYMLEENRAPTWEEATDRTLRRLRNLGNQRFALFPFDEYFGGWLKDLREVLSEFESSPTVRMDDLFVKERSRILSDVALELEERRRERVSREEIARRLSDNRILLGRIEEEYATGTREIERQKNGEIKRLSSNIKGLREELNRITRMKTGIFRAMSKKAKEQKEAEVTQRLSSAQKELASAAQHFTAEQERLRDEYEKKKQPVIDQIRDQQKEVENQEIDWSLEARRAACEALANAVNALLQRKESSHD